ncbi:hypothetical protein GH714_038302 [Hevea brasiliensis]|uniref:Retrotransposon gag domain-containing protein n=1 Tax=Hevea brasiliensis TaxID=3981 RepID=A0A6A6MPK7_HEVBR|nr:hypothetical protein GH714_038302 [Hevea brasiliensis]
MVVEAKHRHEMRLKEMVAGQEARFQSIVDELKSLIARLSQQNIEIAEQRVCRQELVQIEKNEDHQTGERVGNKNPGEQLQEGNVGDNNPWETHENRVKVAALHLKGQAIKWCRGFVQVKGNKAYENWDKYVNALAASFGYYAFNDPIGKLHNLKKSYSLQDRLNSFDYLYLKVCLLAPVAKNSDGFSPKVNELSIPNRMRSLPLDTSKRADVLLEHSPFAGDTEMSNKLMGTYEKRRSMRGAHWVFDRMRKRNIGSWHLLISKDAANWHGYNGVQSYQLEEFGLCASNVENVCSFMGFN